MWLWLLNVPYSAALQRNKGKKLIGLKELDRASQLSLTYLRCRCEDILRTSLERGACKASVLATNRLGNHGKPQMMPTPQKHHCFPSLRSSDGVHPPAPSQTRICSHPPSLPPLKEGGTEMKIRWPASNNCLLCEENSMS